VHGYVALQGDLDWAAEVGKWYDRYHEALLMANAIDFDDLLSLTVALMKQDSEVWGRYQKRFRCE
jgi:DNA helicase-2/ATP-dependent DNA helicase PcrA